MTLSAGAAARTRPSGAQLVAIAAAVLVAFLPVWHAGFVFDDDSFLTANPLIKASDGLYRFWFTGEAVDYWPVTSSSLWLEWRLWGMNPLGYHLTNLALHLGEAYLLFCVLRRLSIPGAFLATLLFAVHPVNVESVAWVTQRKNLLAMLFFLLSILWFLKSTNPEGRPEKRGWYLASLGAFLLAMLSKGSVAMLPFVLLGIAAWRSKLKMKDFAWTLPYFIVSAVLVLVNLHFAHHGPNDVVRNAGLIERILGAGAIPWFYLGKSLFPATLIFVYPHWTILPGNLLWWLPVLCLLGVSFILWRWRQARPLLFAWGYFLAMLVPVMGFTDVYFMKYSLVSDHYQHLALIGVVVALAWGWEIWLKKARPLALAAAAIVLCLLAAKTFAQTLEYRNLETLYRATIADNPDCWMARNNLGILLRDSGRIQEGTQELEAAVRIKPDAVTHYNLGVAYAIGGKNDQAIAEYQKALQIEPNYPGVRYDLGRALAATGQLPGAILNYEDALRLKLNLPEVHLNLGNALADSGQASEAIAQYKEALQLKPHMPDTHYYWGNLLLNSGDYDAAIPHFEEALRLKPDYAEAHYDLGVAMANVRQNKDAIAQYEEALRLKPAYPQAESNLGAALAITGDLDEAVVHYKRALQMRPDDPIAHYNLGLAFRQLGRESEANAEFNEAARLQAERR